MQEKEIQLSKLVGMGFDGAATFSGKKSGVQSRLKKNSPHALFVDCHCHLLQLARVQAANKTMGIKHVYTTLTTLWKFFHYSPKRAECLKEVQRVLNMPELKVVKPSDTRWLAHERCVKAVKTSYSAIVVALNNIYRATHAPEALGISKALCQQSTVAAIFSLDYTLPQVAKLSKTLQGKRLDLTAISSLVESTVHMLNDAVSPAANWVLELQEACNDLEAATDVKVTLEAIFSFQERVAKPFVNDLINNIESRFARQDVASSFSIFDPSKLPSPNSADSVYGEDAINTLIAYYGEDKKAISVTGEEFTKNALVTTELRTE